MQYYGLGHVAMLVVCLLSSSVNAELAKPAMEDNINMWQPGVAKALTPTDYTFTEWPADKIALDCKNSAQGAGIDLGPITTYEVKFPTCGQTWILCRHVNASSSITNMFNVWSRIPVRMKQAVASALFLPSSTRTNWWAYTVGNTQIFWGGWNTMGVYLHENTHAMDDDAAEFNQTALGASTVWKNAYAADSAVVSEYGRSSQGENLAELSSVAIYDIYVPGGAKSLNPNVTKIQHQLDELKYQAKFGKYGGDLFNNSAAIKCTFRWGNSKMVSKNSTASRFMVRDADHLDEQRLQAREAGIELFDDIPGLKARMDAKKRAGWKL